jgi:hypothetical protein
MLYWRVLLQHARHFPQSKSPFPGKGEYKNIQVQVILYSPPIERFNPYQWLPDQTSIHPHVRRLPVLTPR